MNAIKIWGDNVNAYHRAVGVRAVFESYRAWRGVRPWAWLPNSARWDRLRARLFRRFGRSLRSAFVPAWVAEHRRQSGVAPIGIMATDILATRSQRAWRHLLDRAEVELREVDSQMPRLSDPDDPICLQVTDHVRRVHRNRMPALPSVEQLRTTLLQEPENANRQ